MARRIIIQSRESFVNPYIFIPLQKQCSKDYNFKDLIINDDLLTGWIECSLLTKTPVFIPNTTNKKIFTFPDFNPEEDFKCFDFFSYKDLKKSDINPDPPKYPVITSSELRGTIHKSFEPLTNSCLSTIDKDKLLYKRITTSGTPARIYKDKNSWKLQDCERIGINTRRGNNDPNGPWNLNDYHEGQEVFIEINGHYQKRIRGRLVPLFRTVKNISPKRTTNCNVKGYLHKGEPFGKRKHHEAVFIDDKRKNPVNLPQRAVQLFRKNVEMYQKSGNGYNEINLHENKYLVYYSKRISNGKYYLSPAAIGREIYYHTIQDLIKTYQPCQSRDCLCQACLLFGFTSEGKGKKNNALASRIRFTDATLEKEADEHTFFKKGILKELASPQTSATEFYLKKPTEAPVDLWNYDYAGRWQRQNDGNFDLSWNASEKYSPEIAGRKFYWHQKITEEKLMPYVNAKDASSRNTGIRPLAPGLEFSFKIFFNNIKEKELKKLLWVLEIGNNKDNAHKIGMGKPLGLGSIKISVEKIKIREVTLKNNSIRYTIDNYNQILEDTRKLQDEEAASFLGCEPEILRKYLNITNFKNAPTNVEYPNNVGSNLHYEWFMSNRTIRPGSPFRNSIHQTIPEDETNPRLFKYDLE